MFEWLAEFNRIFVTGPQRSGTRICAQMIAFDTGHEFIDEFDFQMDSLYWLFSLLEHEPRAVIQCPVLCRNVHTFSGDSTAIVLVRRNVQDIIASQKRISWQWEPLELSRYDRAEGVIAEVKYQFWEEYQRERIKHAFEIEYERLAEHPLWLPKQTRQKFEPTQTAHQNGSVAIGDNVHPRTQSGILGWEGAGPDEIILVKTREPARVLNETGKLIWALCDGLHSRQDILQALKERFDDIDENVLAQDLDAFLNQLMAQRFLQLTSIPSNTPKRKLADNTR